MEWAKDWVTDKIATYATLGIQAGGNLAGNTVGGVGSLIENSGRSVGQSASGIAGAIGGVGNYINNYGENVKASLAADGPVGGGAAAKKTAVKPAAHAGQGLEKTATGTHKTALSGAGTVPKKAPSISKALPAAISPSKAATQTGAANASPGRVSAAKPPPQTNRNLPAKKPVPPVTTKSPNAKNAPSSTTASGKTDLRIPISTGQSERTADGKVKIAPTSRPQPGKNTRIANGSVKSGSSNVGTRSAPVRAPISTRQSPTRADGKVRISPESRPRPVKAN